MKIIEILKEFFINNSEVLIQLAVHGFILWLILKFINHAAKKIKIKLQSETNNVSMLHLLLVLTRIIKIIAVLLIITSFLQSNGYSLTSLMTGLGITGLAVGFAAKETLSSVFGSISIMADKIYKIGDYVIINGVEGVVETINFHSTKIRTVNNILITIPNNITADTIVQNRSDAEYIKLIENFDIEYDTSDDNIEQALNILNNICNSIDEIQNDYQTLIAKLGENAITLQLIANTTTGNWMEYLKIKDRLYKETLRQFRQNNINFAFPSRTVYVQNKNED